MLTSELRMLLSYFEHAFLVFVLGAIPNRIHLNYRCIIKLSNSIRHILLFFDF